MPCTFCNEWEYFLYHHCFCLSSGYTFSSLETILPQTAKSSSSCQEPQTQNDAPSSQYVSRVSQTQPGRVAQHSTHSAWYYSQHALCVVLLARRAHTVQDHLLGLSCWEIFGRPWHRLARAGSGWLTWLALGGIARCIVLSMTRVWARKD